MVRRSKSRGDIEKFFKNGLDEQLTALLPKRPKRPRPDFADARRACRTITEREDLALVLRAGWKSSELHEFARLHFFKDGKDYPTATSYRHAVGDLATHYAPMKVRLNAKPSAFPHDWLRQFRKGGSKPLPPRREGLLKRGRGHGSTIISSAEYAWLGHTEKYRALIEQLARDYFKLSPEQSCHPNAWAAAQRAYFRRQSYEAEAAEKASRPKAPKSTKADKRKLPPWFNRDWAGHTDAFREEVAALARKDKGLPADAYVSNHAWKITANKFYELTEGNTAS
jgi:hypothetical protein